MYFDTQRKEECCGCTACVNACPTTAIKMVEDDEGFYYPQIDESKCIHCNLCHKVCSWEHPNYDNEKEAKAYAAVVKNKDERQRSTSGGVFYVISEWIINKGGVVYGAAFDDSFQLYHVAAENMQELQRIRGSKYIQSNLGDVFKGVKKNLESGRWCYFTGTGCQVAGLYAYLRKNYPTLLTSDLVCHGVPSQKLFNLHIEYMQKKYHDKVNSYRFRDYKLGGGCEACGFANRKQVIKPSYELSPYLYSFMHAFTYRLSCYECKFAKVPRQGDITLADYWGVRHFFPQFDNSNGCSLILVNTKRGNEIWNQVSSSCEYENSTVSDASQFNGNLIRPSQKPPIRDGIFRNINEKGYSKIAQTTFRSPNYTRLRIIYFLLGFRPIKAVYSLLRK